MRFLLSAGITVLICGCNVPAINQRAQTGWRFEVLRPPLMIEERNTLLGGNGFDPQPRSLPVPGPVAAPIPLAAPAPLAPCAELIGPPRIGFNGPPVAVNGHPLASRLTLDEWLTLEEHMRKRCAKKPE